MATTDKRRVTFAPYDPDEKKSQRKPSAVAFMMLRQALKLAPDRPDKAEVAGSWRRTSDLQLLFSDLEAERKEVAGINGATGLPVEVPIVVLEPTGGSFVVSHDHVKLLEGIWTDWMKTKGTRALALEIEITNQFMGLINENDGPPERRFIACGITSADAEAPIVTGAVLPPVAPPVPAPAAPATPVVEGRAPTPSSDLAPVGG